jgi:hypothetical protein
MPVEAGRLGESIPVRQAVQGAALLERTDVGDAVPFRSACPPR